jgi:hypothetical protein
MVRMKAFLVLCLVLAAMVSPARAADEKPVGYGGAIVQLAPFMAPYRSSEGIRYQVMTFRLVLDVGLNERAACFMAPIVHEKFLLYLYKKMPTPEDFQGQRKDVMLEDLLKVATEATTRGMYSAIQLVDETSPELDPKSKTLTSQCK